MKAVRIRQWGQPLQIEDIPQPTPAQDEALVRVHASSVNPIDGIIAAGHMQAMYSLPMTLGTDFAGDVVSARREVHHIQPGDAVYGMSLQRGTFAEFAAVKTSGVARKPRSLDYVQADCLERLANALQPGKAETGRAPFDPRCGGRHRCLCRANGKRERRLCHRQRHAR